MKRVYTISKVIISNDEVEKLESAEAGFYTEYENAVAHAASLHETSGQKYAIFQIKGITGTVVKPIDGE